MKKMIWPLMAVLMTLNILFAVDMPPKQEFRGVWLSTVGNIDWPKSKYDSDAKKQSDLKNYLQKAKNTGLNSVLFQVRCACDAMYNSPYEPWSYWFSGTQGQAPSVDWDPLVYAVEEAHKLGLELHAWVNPYRAVKTPSMRNNADYMSDEHVSRTHPEWILKFSDIYILNPGLPEVREYITMILMDIVNRYDIDGLHMDDYFYPYSRITNEDAQTFADHSRGFTNIHDWRRDNINLLVEMVSDSINIVKPWVKWGISPFGVWKPNVPEGISATDAYNILYCDPIAWLQDQTVDYITPQLYWPFGGGQDYGKLVPWWAKQARIYGRHFYPGQALFNVYEEDWGVNEIPNQIQLNRDTDYCDGSVFFTAHSIDRNAKGVVDIIKTNYYKYPAMWPVMPWKNSVPTEAPDNAVLTINGDGSKTLVWDAPNYTDPVDSAYGYAVFRTPHPLVELNMEDLIDLRLDQPKTFVDDEDGMYYYGITALNRNKLESPIAQIEYPFVHPLFPEYADDWAPKDPTMTWVEKEGASQYTLEISENSDLSNAVQYMISDTTKDLVLSYTTDYFWRIKSDNTSYWSPIWTFKTEEPPQVEICSPLAYYEGTSISPQINWKPFENASYYELQLASDEAMTNLIVDQSSLTDTAFQCNNLDYGTYYYWRVKSDVFYRWTDVAFFKTREEFIEASWQRTRLAQDYPSFMDSTLEANGLATGPYGDGSIVLVLQSNGDSVRIDAMDPLNGEAVAFDLNMTGVQGGTHKLRDIEISDDGVIFAANCANIGETFKVYRWGDEASAPTCVYEAENVAYRIGDHITVTGRSNDGSVTLYAPAALSDKMLKLEWNSISNEFEATQLTLDRGNNTNPGMAVNPNNGELYVSSNDYYLRHFTNSGKNIAWMKFNNNMPQNANSLVSFTYNNKTYIAGYVQDTESAHIIDVSSGVKTALKAGSTYRMGIKENPDLLGDVEVMDNEDGTFTLYVLGDQNGVGAYIYDAVSAMVDVADVDIPANFELKQNYPNPFNPVTTIQYNLKEDSEISISVFDLSGKHIITLFEGSQLAGYHELKFNASELASGQYLYRLTAGDVSVTRKMILLK